MISSERDALPTQLAWPALVGGVAALAGTYWDDAWHTDRGRDSFFIAPHLMLYGGVFVAAIAVALWLVVAVRRSGIVGAFRTNPPVRWAAIGAGAVFVSAPLDEMWHTAYGRDAVLFSPPHLLAIVASATLVISLVGGLGRATEPMTGASRALRLTGAAGVLGALLVPVMEYEADVPQFSSAWFLPIVTAAVVVARPVAALLLGGRWPLSRAALLYTVGRLILVGALAGGGFSTPIVPPVLLAAVVADVVAAKRWPWTAQAVAVATAVHLAYVPWLAVVPHGVPVTGGDLVTSAGAAVLAGLAARLALRPPTPAPSLAMGAAGLILALFGIVAVARPASAHDPGQGELQGDAELTATVEGRAVQLEAAVTGVDCGSLDDPTIVARRAGMTRSAPMIAAGNCTFAGELPVPEEGRWFVYATFDTTDGTLESWLPVEVADGSGASASRDLYQPPTSPDRSSQAVAGAVLLVAAALLLVGSLRSIAAYENDGPLTS